MMMMMMMMMLVVVMMVMMMMMMLVVVLMMMIETRVLPLLLEYGQKKPLQFLIPKPQQKLF